MDNVLTRFNNNAKAQQDIILGQLYVGWLNIDGCVMQEMLAHGAKRYCLNTIIVPQCAHTHFHCFHAQLDPQIHINMFVLLY